MIELVREFRRAARALSRTPAFSIACVLTLALGIGAITTIFAFVDAILLKPLPFRAGRLVDLSHTAPGLELEEAGLSDGTYLHYRDHARLFEDMATYYENVVNLSAAVGDAERVPVAMVSHTFFDVLGARTALGRLPAATDADTTGEVVVLISHDLWRRHYGSNPDIIGSMIEVNRVHRRVIGVLEAGFEFPRTGTAIWYPEDPDPVTARASDLYKGGIARLRPGVTVAAAERELNGLIGTLPESWPDLSTKMLSESKLRAIVRPLRDAVVGDVRATLWLLLGGMSFLLLVACANVANLFLVRGEQRERELAIRTALGAGRRALVRWFAAESLLVAVPGGALGLLLADNAVQALIVWGPARLPRLEEVVVDGRVVAFVAAVSILAGLVLALLPAARAARPVLTTALRESAFGSTASLRRLRARNLIVAGQLALALALLASSSLMGRSLWRLTRANPGFDARGVLTAEIALPREGYADAASTRRFWDELLDRVRALPGVEAAGVASGLPLVPRPSYHDFALDIESRPGESRAAVTLYHVTSGYFETMRIPLLEGRGVDEAVDAVAHPVLLSAAAARRLFPGESPLGQRLRRAEGPDRTWATVAGVVADVPKAQIGGESAEVVYIPILDDPVDPGLIPMQGTLVVRTSLPPMSVATPMRSIVRGLDLDLPVANVRSLEAIVAASRARTTFTMMLMVVAAAAALLLGAIGLYGVVAWAVGRRTHEIGIRVALGARADDVRALLIRENAPVVAGGIAIGTLVALALTRFLRSLLYDVSPTDPLSFLATLVLLLLTAGLAVWLPSRRAVRIQPTDALRSE